jgi:hypothetical protein
MDDLTASPESHPMSPVTWLAWIDDLPLPAEFREGQEALQEYLHQLAQKLAAAAAHRDSLAATLIDVQKEKIAGEAEAAVLRVKLAEVRQALNATAEQALQDEIPEGSAYDPSDGEFDRGYDAAISVARSVLARTAPADPQQQPQTVIRIAKAPSGLLQCEVDGDNRFLIAGHSVQGCLRSLAAAMEAVQVETEAGKIEAPAHRQDLCSACAQPLGGPHALDCPDG